MNLQDVCENLLDNADMSIDFSAYPDVVIEMWVQGTVKGGFWKVVFKCSQVVYIEAAFDDDSFTNDLFTLLDTKVKKMIKRDLLAAAQDRMDGLQDVDPVWEIYLYGAASITIVTTTLTWELIELSESEYSEVYS